MKRRILIVLVPAFDPNQGGVQMSTYKLATYFRSQGLEVNIFSFEPQGHMELEGVTVHHADEPGFNHHPTNLSKCGYVLKAVRPDIVINQMPYEFNVGRLLKQLRTEGYFFLLGCLRGSFFAVKLNLETYRKTLLPLAVQPFFKNKVGYWMLLQFHKWKHSRDLRLIMDTYDYYVLFGQPNRKELQYFIGNYKSNKLAFIPNSIPSVVEYIPTKEKKILWLSRVDYRQKNADLIVPLWRRIKDHLPDWQLDVVGNGGALDDIKRKVKEEQLERITLYGKQKPDSYFSRSPIYLMTSSFEGFPNTLIEAQSFGCVPIVFDSYPMLREIISRNNAILTKTFDLDAMAKEIIALAQDSTRLQKLMENSIQNARRFTIEQIGPKWLELFNDYAKHEKVS